jgi:ribose transport system ATP-binding protein
VFLAQEKRFSTFGVLSDKKMIERTRVIFEELGVDRIRPTDLLSKYNFAERQVVEIVRSIAQADLLGIEHPVILLDEPTSALSREQIDFFFTFVNSIKHRAAQVFVSHRLLEVLELCDRLFVMKDGKRVADIADPSAVTEDDLHLLMVGRSTAAEFDEAERVGPDRSARPVLSLKGFSGKGFDNVDLDLFPGEILGVAGVIGAGKSDVARAVFEAGHGTTGTIEFNGQAMKGGGPREAIRSGIGYVPPERHAEGIIEVLSVAKNLSLPAVGSVGRNPIVKVRQEATDADAAIKLLSIKTRSSETTIGSLSGGNQQKVVLARWTTLKSRLLVLDNPTNGVDVGAKVELYRIIRRLTDEGVSVLLMSDDLQELIGMSDRILVMKDGHITSEMKIDPANRPSEVEVVAHMV